VGAWSKAVIMWSTRDTGGRRRCRTWSELCKTLLNMHCTAKTMSYLQYIWLSLWWFITANNAQYCVTNLTVTHETVYNAQTGISRCWSRHCIRQKTIPSTPNNKQQNNNWSFHL